MDGLSDLFMDYRVEQWKAAIAAHLESLHSSQYGRSMSISKPEDRWAAADELWGRLIGPVVRSMESGQYDS